MGIKYALCVFQEGFTRTKQNIREQDIIVLKTTVMSLGNVSYEYEKVNFHLYFCIIDGVNKNIAMYRKSIREGREPLYREGLESQIGFVFDPYFKIW